MLHQIKLITTLSLLSFLSVSTPVFAGINTSNEVSVSKEDWLKAFRALAPEAICKGIMSGEKTNALLKENGITLEKCKPLITQSLNRCLEKYSAAMPTNIPESESKNLGEKLGKCSGEDFYTHYIEKNASLKK